MPCTAILMRINGPVGAILFVLNEGFLDLSLSIRSKCLSQDVNPL